MANTVLLLAILCFATVFCTNELLRNGDIESTSGWHCSSCTMALNTNRFSGKHSIKVTNRHQTSSGVTQTVTVTPGKRYVSRCYFKLLNMTPGHAYTEVQLMAASHASGHTHYIKLSRLKIQQVKDGWTEIGGDILVGSGTHTMEFYLNLETSINYLIDDCSVFELIGNINWKSEAQAQINKIRKAPITIDLAGQSDTHPYYIELIQEKRSFAWGTAVKFEHITDNFTKFQDFLFDNFEWTVPANAMKWRLMEWQKGHENYDWMSALNKILSKGMKVRGHNMFWATDKHAPAWLNGLSSQQVVAEMQRHVTNMLAHTKGLLQHWDVNNENLHGDYYERHTGNPDITNNMFQWIHHLEPNVKLFLNDFNVVTRSEMATAIKVQALRMKKAGVPLNGIGVQAHFPNSNIDLAAVKYRLDKVAEAGLPIWITELTVLDSNENSKANALEDVLTLFHSHPSVEGILIWNFWDGAIFDPRAAITNGPSVTPNAAGVRYLKLVNHDWKTNQKRSVLANHPAHLRGFMGDYLLKVKHNGHFIYQERFSLDKHGQNLTIHLADIDKRSDVREETEDSKKKKRTQKTT